MKKLIILLLCTSFYFNGCTEKRLIPDEKRADLAQSCSRTIDTYAHDDTKLNKILNKRVYDFQETVEEILVLHEKSAIVLKSLLTEEQKNKPISAKQLDVLLSTIQKDIEHLKTVAMILNTNTCWRHPAHKKQLSSQLKIKGSLLELASALFLYDYYLNTAYKVNEDKRIRRLLNQGDSGYDIGKDKLMQMQDLLSDFSNLNNLENYIKKYKNRHKKIKSLGERDDNIAYLDQFIKSSQAYRLFGKKSFSLALAKKSAKRRKNVRDNLNALNRRVINSVSETFGNLTGRYEERKGKLYQDKKIEKDIVKHLKSADILLEKTPYLVVESLREGTTLNTMAHFLNVDDIAVLRYRKPLSKQEKAHIIIIALRQIGKAYDFNYDVETTDKIVCSQLVYLSYTDINWPTENILGRYTISPDNIAVKVTDGKQLTTILLYLDGGKVKKSKNHTMGKLLQDAKI